MTGCIRRSKWIRLGRVLCFGSAYIARGQSLAHSIPRDSSRLACLSDNKLRVPGGPLDHHQGVSRFPGPEAHSRHFQWAYLSLP
jgi:hypothetical protein